MAHPSICTALHFRAYFLQGRLPAEGTICDADPGFLFPAPAALLPFQAAVDVLEKVTPQAEMRTPTPQERDRSELKLALKELSEIRLPWFQLK